jgi:N-methylhydantoinase A
VRELRPPWRIGVDVGGTFTDLYLIDATGQELAAKVASVPDDPARAIFRALEAAAEQAGIDASRLLRECALLVHGTTIATNTLIQRTGARVGLLTTAGFRDTLEIRRGLREDQWDHRSPFAEVLVPRHLRLPVRGRLDRTGAEIEPLIEEDVVRAAEVFAAERVEAVAVCLLNAYLDPAHETRSVELLSESLGDIPVVSSHAVLPLVGEYERSSTTVASAFLSPVTSPYLRRLDDRLRDRGLGRGLFVLQSNGGCASVDEAIANPAPLLLSGPAAGLGALGRLATKLGGDLISMEIGGTSCDVMLMEGGAVATREAVDIAGHSVAVAAVDIHTVGAGGGAIASVGPGGFLRVGPRGAGAAPGPACYGLGGVEPTVTDAQLVLGRLRPGSYAAGAVEMYPEPARTAIEERLARPLGVAVDEAAAGVVRLLEQHLVQAVETVSAARGRDPRRFTLVAAGGAGPMHACAVARHLACPRVFVPRSAGVYCAQGMLHSDVRFDFVRTLYGRLDEVLGDGLEGGGELATAFGSLETEARRALEAEGFAEDRRHFDRHLELRYRGQHWPVKVALADMQTADEIVHAFESEHDRLFGHTQPDGVVEVTGVRLVAVGQLPKPAAGGAVDADPPVARPRAQERSVFVDERSGWRSIPVHDGRALGEGDELVGPLLVEEATTTVVVGVGDVLRVHPLDGFDIEVAR